MKTSVMTEFRKNQSLPLPLLRTIAYDGLTHDGKRKENEWYICNAAQHDPSVTQFHEYSS